MQRHNLLQNAIVYDAQPAEGGLFNQILGKRRFEEELQLNSAAASILKATPPAQDASVTFSSVPYSNAPTKHLIGNTFPIVHRLFLATDARSLCRAPISASFFLAWTQRTEWR